MAQHILQFHLKSDVVNPYHIPKGRLTIYYKVDSNNMLVFLVPFNLTPPLIVDLLYQSITHIALCRHAEQGVF